MIVNIHWDLMAILFRKLTSMNPECYNDSTLAHPLRHARNAEGLGGADLACITCITFFLHSYLSFPSRESEHRHSVFAETSKAFRHHCRCDRCRSRDSNTQKKKKKTVSHMRVTAIIATVRQCEYVVVRFSSI